MRLLKDQKSYKSVAARRARLPDKVLERMKTSSRDNDPHGFRRVAWLFTNVGRYAGLRFQEYGMDSHDVIKYYVLSDGTKVMRAFAVKDLLFYDEDGVLFSGLPATQESVEAVEIQKNRQNRQTQRFAAFPVNTAVLLESWTLWTMLISWVPNQIRPLASIRKGRAQQF